MPLTEDQWFELANAKGEEALLAVMDKFNLWKWGKADPMYWTHEAGYQFYKPVNTEPSPPVNFLIQAETQAKALAMARLLGPTERVEQVLYFPGDDIYIAA